MPTELKERYPFSVDSWTVLSKRKRHHFLTHAHSDHTGGIQSFAQRPIYCSDMTRRLVLRRFPKLETCQFIILEIGEAKLVPDDEEPFTVTALDANHCPGAVMLLFEGSFGNVLHTGDCRLTEDCLSNVLGKYRAQIRVLDCVFLDCTFGRELLKMPSKEEACWQVQQCILDHRKAPVVYLACDLLGQEELLSHLVRTFGTKIFIDKEALPEYFADMMMVAPDLVTEDPLSTRFHICEGFPKLYERAKIKFMQAHKRGLEAPLFIRPSAQWYTYEERLEGAGCGMILEVALKGPGRRHQPRAVPKIAEKDQFGVWHVCYSIHSCRLELVRAMEILWPKEVISTTPNCHASEVMPKKASHPIIVSAATACRVSKGSHEEEAGSRRDVTEKCNFKVNSAVLSSPTNPRARKKFCPDEKPNKDYLPDDLSVIVPLFGLARHTIPASPPLSFASTDSESDEESVDLQSTVECSSGGCEGSPKEPQKTCESVNYSTLLDPENHGVSVKPIAASLERIKQSTETHSNQNTTRSWILASPADGEDFGTNELENKENITTSVAFSDNNNIMVSSKGSSHILGLAVFKESTRNVYRSLRAPIPSPLPSLLDLYNSPWMSEQI